MRESIFREIHGIEPADAIESADRSDALAWIASGAPLWRLLKPASPPKHLVSYFAVIDDDGLLLVDHKNAQLWLPTGGHVDVDEHPRETVRRELREELGLSLAHDIGPPIMISCDQTVGLTAGHTDVCLWYLVKGSRTQPLSYDDEEFTTVQWFDFSAIPFERSNPNLRRFVTKLRSNQAIQRAMTDNFSFSP